MLFERGSCHSTLSMPLVALFLSTAVELIAKSVLVSSSFDNQATLRDDEHFKLSHSSILSIN